MAKGGGKNTHARSNFNKMVGNIYGVAARLNQRQRPPLLSLGDKFPINRLCDGADRRFNGRQSRKRCARAHGRAVYMPTDAELVESVAVLTSIDRGNVEPANASSRSLDSEHRVLKVFNAVGWASIGLLFAHAVLVSVEPSMCLLGCKALAVTAHEATPAAVANGSTAPCTNSCGAE